MQENPKGSPEFVEDGVDYRFHVSFADGTVDEFRIHDAGVNARIQRKHWKEWQEGFESVGLPVTAASVPDTNPKRVRAKNT